MFRFIIIIITKTRIKAFFKLGRRRTLEISLFEKTEKVTHRMGKKEKKVLDESKTEDSNEPSYEDRLQYVSVIAEPMASKKLAKKVTS